MKSLMIFFKSNTAVFVGAVMALSTQLWHSIKAFVMLDVGGSENYWNYLFGGMFSLSTSFAILLFTVRGRKGLAYFFLAVEVFINLIHYSVLDMPLGPILIATLFMCLIVPVTISTYSAEIDPDQDEEKPARPSLRIIEEDHSNWKNPPKKEEALDDPFIKNDVLMAGRDKPLFNDNL